MKRSAMRGAVAVAALGAVALFGGCGGNSGAEDLSGAWAGSLSLNLAGGSGLAGRLELVLDQTSAGFASGVANWAPIGETQGIAGPIDGTVVTLRLVFRCEESFETAALSGTVAGDTITISAASGEACALGAPPAAVEGASGSLTRTSNNVPR